MGVCILCGRGRNWITKENPYCSESCKKLGEYNQITNTIDSDAQ